MLQTDYLIIGCGATALAFVDTLLTESDANILIVDRNAKPGGHWTVAYPFVTLHQPSQFYGVASRELSDGRIDVSGLNRGLHSLATLDQIQNYYEAVMQETFLPSGRVQYFPECEYLGNHEFKSLKTGEIHQVEVRKKVIDATYFQTQVPALHTPNFEIAQGVKFIPINDLPNVNNEPEGFVIIGGGKTGIDACLWLLEKGTDPDKITWIVSRDAWLINRKNVQPTDEYFEASIGSMAAQMEGIAKSNSVEEMFDNMEEAEVFVRIDQTVRPQMFHGATISPLELEELRKIRNVVRLGRVQCIESERIILEKGTLPTSKNHVHVDCSASAISNLEVRPIFEEGMIFPQTVRSYQPTFSASMIAYVEANYKDDATKNKICQVVQLPNADTDWIPMMESQMMNQFTWSQDKKLREWIRENRLDGFGKMIKNVDKEDIGKMEILNRFRKNMVPAMIQLQKYAKELDPQNEIPIENPQMQVSKDVFFKNRLVEMPPSANDLEEGEILVRIEKFAYTANNITYAAAGDMIGYWKFFPPFGEKTEGWGVIPVWGFGEVIQSNHPEVPVGDRLFGYFPPAKTLKMRPVGIKPGRVIDGSAHRSMLPAGYNIYRRVFNEPHYNPAHDKARMLLFPLHLTSYCIWDALREKDWYGAEQILVLSASSKTSTGLGYALQADKNAPKVIGITSQRNLATVQEMKIYDEVITYDSATEIPDDIPTVIVDMSGNTKIMAALHTHLAENMKHTINVGLTHWTDTRPQPGIIQARSEFFFAPGHIQKRIKEWGAEGFNQKTAQFMMETAAKTALWLKFQTLNGLEELAEIHPAVCMGQIPADVGLVVEV